NTPLIGLVEKHVVPQSTTGKVLAAPLYVPVGMVAGILDVFIVHPYLEIPNAWKDMVELFWTREKKRYVTEMGSLPLRLGISPVVFSLDLLARIMFDLSGSSAEIEKPVQTLTIEEMISRKDVPGIQNWLLACG